MNPSLNSQQARADEHANPLHLVHPSSRLKPLCGEASTDAVIGAYVEHLDLSIGAPRWVRQVFDRNGKPTEGCAHCLALYPSVLL